MITPRHNSWWTGLLQDIYIYNYMIVYIYIYLCIMMYLYIHTYIYIYADLVATSWWCGELLVLPSVTPADGRTQGRCSREMISNDHSVCSGTQIWCSSHLAVLREGHIRKLLHLHTKSHPFLDLVEGKWNGFIEHVGLFFSPWSTRAPVYMCCFKQTIEITFVL